MDLPNSTTIDRHPDGEFAKSLITKRSDRRRISSDGHSSSFGDVMALRLASLLVDYLAKHAGEKFTARQIAAWIFKTYPAECAEKRARSAALKSDGDVVQQLVSEIGSQAPALRRRHSQLAITDTRPRQYYWVEPMPENHGTAPPIGSAIR